jgi:hypothetical protein
MTDERHETAAVVPPLGQPAPREALAPDPAAPDAAPPAEFLSAAPPTGEKTGSWPAGWLWQELPFALMLLLGVVGASWTAFRGEPAVAYWVLLVPVFCVTCILAGWPNFTTTRDRLVHVGQQALAWAGLLAAMYLMFLPDVRGVITDNASGLTLVTMLAFGTFVAGLLARVWRIAVVGIFLGLSVPVMAWLQQAAPLLGLLALALAALSLTAWWLKAKYWDA